MNMKYIYRPIMAGLILWFSVLTFGQPPRGPWVNSPQINPDKTVVFRYMAPLAKDVKLSAQFEKEPLCNDKRCFRDMERNSWTC